MVTFFGRGFFLGVFGLVLIFPLLCFGGECCESNSNCNGSCGYVGVVHSSYACGTVYYSHDECTDYYVRALGFSTCGAAQNYSFAGTYYDGDCMSQTYHKVYQTSCCAAPWYQAYAVYCGETPVSTRQCINCVCSCSQVLQCSPGYVWDGDVCMCVEGCTLNCPEGYELNSNECKCYLFGGSTGGMGQSVIRSGSKKGMKIFGSGGYEKR